MRTALAATVALLALTACSSGGEADAGTADPAPTQPAPTLTEPPSNPSAYVLNTEEGARVTVEPVEADDPRVADVADFAPDAYYVIADVDNRAGTTPMHIDYVTVITDTGHAVTLPYAAAGSDAILEANDFHDGTAMDLYNDLLNQQQVRPGQRIELVYATAEDVPNVAHVSLPVTELGEELVAEPVA